MFIFPYAFVDTSEAWFEPRRRRIAISAAGPVSDFSIGGVFALCCLVFPEGTVRDIFFQLAFAAYVGAFFNLNPFLDRDGYHILVDVLREPGLRRRAKEQFERRLSGQRNRRDRFAGAGALRRVRARVVGRVRGASRSGCHLRYKTIMRNFAPSYVVWTVLVTLWLALFIPVFVVLGKPLVNRVRGA